MTDSEWLMETIAWLWGIVTEEASLRGATTVGNWLRPWRWPVVRHLLARSCAIWTDWKLQYQAQSRTWRILIGSMLAGLLTVFLSVGAHAFTVGGDFGLTMLAWHIAGCSAVGMIQVAMVVQLLRERLLR